MISVRCDNVKCTRMMQFQSAISVIMKKDQVMYTIGLPRAIEICPSVIESPRNNYQPLPRIGVQTVGDYDVLRVQTKKNFGIHPPKSYRPIRFPRYHLMLYLDAENGWNRSRNSAFGHCETFWLRPGRLFNCQHASDAS